MDLPPGISKSALAWRFADVVGLERVSILDSPKIDRNCEDQTRSDQHRQGFTYFLPEGHCLLLRVRGELAYLAASVDSAGALGSANLPPAALAI